LREQCKRKFRIENQPLRGANCFAKKKKKMFMDEELIWSNEKILISQFGGNLLLCVATLEWQEAAQAHCPLTQFEIRTLSLPKH
jgi:hypothetical protein